MRAAAAESKGQDRRLANHEKMIAALSSDNEALTLEKMELKTLLVQQERKNNALIKETDGLQRALHASSLDVTAAHGTGVRFQAGQLPSAHTTEKQLLDSLRVLLVPSTSASLPSSSFPGRTCGGEGVGREEIVSALDIMDASPEQAASASGRGLDETDVGDGCDVIEGERASGSPVREIGGDASTELGGDAST